MIHLVQIGNGAERRVAMVEEPQLRCLEGVAACMSWRCAMRSSARR